MKLRTLAAAALALSLNFNAQTLRAQTAHARRAAATNSQTTRAVSARERAASLAHTDDDSASPSARSAQMLPIRRVILYSNGVAYIERRGRVSGHA